MSFFLPSFDLSWVFYLLYHSIFFLPLLVYSLLYLLGKHLLIVQNTA